MEYHPFQLSKSSAAIYYWLPINTKTTTTNTTTSSSSSLLLISSRDRDSKNNNLVPLSNLIPYHLYMRLRERSANLVIGGDRSTSDAAVHRWNHNVDPRQRYNTRKGGCHVEARRERLIARLKRIEEVRNEKLARDERISQERRSRFDMKHAEAQRLRARRIEQQVRLCAHATEKAKAISLVKRERDNAMKLRIRENLEKRMFNATTRLRLLGEIKQLGLSRTGWPVGSKDRKEAQDLKATLRIQRWWRQRKVESWLKSYQNYDWTEQTWKSTPFTELAEKLQNVQLLEIIKNLLYRVIICTNAERPSKNTHRIFLTAWMILYQEEHVFQERGSLERDLKLAAEDVVLSWGSYVKHYRTQEAHEHAQKFSEVFQHFLRRFHEWKSPDALKLTEKLIDHYMELEHFKNSVVDINKEAMDKWNSEIEAQQRRIIEELGRLNGRNALQMLITRIRQLRTSEHTKWSPTDEGSKARETLEMTRDRDDSSSETSDEILFRRRQMFVQLWRDKIMDPSGLAEPESKSNQNLEKHAIQIAKMAFWDRFRERLKQKIYSDVPQILSDLKSSLRRVVIQGKIGLYESMTNHLDSALILQQLEMNVFDLREWIWPILRGIKKLCAPIRDHEIAALEHIVDPTDLLQGLFDVLDKMREDYLLLMFREPSLFEASLITYEQQSFRERLATSSTDLASTMSRVREWLQPTRKDMHSCFSQVRELVYKAFLELVTSSESPDSIPETLSLDRGFLFRIQNSIQESTTIAILLILLRSSFPEFNTQGILKQQLLPILRRETSRLIDIQLIIMDHLRSHYTISSSQEEILCNLIHKLLRKNESILISLLGRTQEVLFYFLQRRHWNTDALARSSLDNVLPELQSVANRLVHFFKIHLAIYEPFYRECLESTSKNTVI